jgi:serine/threonine-protein kinase
MDDSPKPTHTKADSTDTKPEPPVKSGPQPTANPPQPTPPQPSALAARDAHDKYANLEARAQAADAGVQQIRSQQQAQGLDMRGDILASMTRMNNFMNQAKSALARNDLESANDYMDRADREISVLEKFLGH